MEITQKMTEYKTANYRIQVEIFKGKFDLTVFDNDNNLVVMFDSLKEAENISKEILQVLEQLKI